MQVYDSESATVIAYPEKKIIYHQIHKYITDQEYKTVLSIGADNFIKFNCTKWLANDRKNSSTYVEDIGWYVENWESRIINAGWKYWAVVMPEMVTVQMFVSKFINKYKTMGIHVRAFNDVDKAMAWLEEI